MRPIKVYVTQNNLASIRCPECGRQKTIETSKFKRIHKAIMVKCTCNSSFPIILEKRRHYRKMVNFMGHYSSVDNPISQKPITIENISRTGMKFRTSTQNQVTVGQNIIVHFVLDDDQRTSLDLKVTVVRVQGLEAGVEYTDANIPKALAFYLLP